MSANLNAAPTAFQSLARRAAQHAAEDAGLPGRYQQNGLLILAPSQADWNDAIHIVGERVSLQLVPGGEYGLYGARPEDVPIVRSILREIEGTDGIASWTRQQAQEILATLERQGMCPDCGEVHPYGGLCTSCLERKVAAEERADALSQGYHVGRDGQWYHREQLRDERGVFSEDRGRR